VLQLVKVTRFPWPSNLAPRVRHSADQPTHKVLSQLLIVTVVLHPSGAALSQQATHGHTDIDLYRIYWVSFFLEKLIVAQLDKKLPFFYGTRKFITVFTTAYLSQLNSLCSRTLYFFNISLHN
jgi:hypothetical protein